MTDEWRLVNGIELYKIKTDKEQRTNIASKYPKVVEKLKNEYEIWWMKTSVRANQYQYINIGDNSITTLFSHDLHNEQNKIPAWNQEMVRQGVSSKGYWTVEVTKKGLYHFKLMRWAPESGLGVLSAAPEGRTIPNGKAYSKGKVLNIKGAKLKIGLLEYSATISENYTGQAIDFLIPIEIGKYNISADFFNDKGIQFSPYYIVVKATN
jgi:hypothetical protein